MKCIFCGRSESDCEIIDKEIIKIIEKALKTLNKKKNEYKSIIENDTEKNADKDFGKSIFKIFLSEIERDLKIIVELKEIISIYELSEFELQNKHFRIIKKYLVQNERKMGNYKICLRCEFLINNIVKRIMRKKEKSEEFMSKLFPDADTWK